MKKLLALALILTLALSVSVFAAEPVKHNVVGGSTGYGTDEFEPTTNDKTILDITAQVGTVVHMYAVDLEYTPVSVSVSGATLTWDAEHMVYVASGEGDASGATGKVVIINRSDLPIDASYTISDKDTSDHLTVAVTDELANTCTESTVYTVDKATAGVDGNNGTATTKTFNLTVNADGDNWEAVSTYYAGWFTNNPTEDTRVIAQLTFKIAMTPAS